jgi:hypothetical protein
MKYLFLLSMLAAASAGSTAWAQAVPGFGPPVGNSAGLAVGGAGERQALQDEQQRRAALRAAIEAQRNAKEAAQASRHLSPQERAELREQLRQAQPAAWHAGGGAHRP